MQVQTKKEGGWNWRETVFILLIALGVVIAGVPNAHAWQQATIYVSCPEGTQTVHEGGYPLFRPSIDLFAGLYHDIRRIRVCAQSGFPSYKDFTKDELERVSALMETSAFQTRAKTLTHGAFALWIEEELTGAVEPRLAYQLRLQDAYTSIAGDPLDVTAEKKRLRAVFDVVQGQHAAIASDPGELTRLQLQLAFLAHTTGAGFAKNWFDSAWEGFDALPMPRDAREPGLPNGIVRLRAKASHRYETLRRNLIGVKLCLEAPVILMDALCEARLNAQDGRRGYHGIEALAHWALRGPTPPDSTEEEDSLRASLKRAKASTSKHAPRWRMKAEAQLAKGPDYFRQRAKHTHQKMQTILHERARNPLFKEQFDRLFVMNIKGSTGRYAEGPYYYCDLWGLITPYTKNQCHLDGTPIWIAAHERFPDLMADLREERRLQVLQGAAYYYLKGEKDHRSIQWALRQDDFDEAIEADRRKNRKR